MKKPSYTFPPWRDGVRIALILGFVLGSLIGDSSHKASAAEPARDFLKGLRDRGYHDVALDYLQLMEKSPLAPIELKETMLYERGVILIEGSQVQRDQAIRESYLDEAQQLLRQFLEDRAQHPLANAARSQLGNVIVGHAQILVEQAKEGNKEAKLKQAYQRYEEAYKVFTEQEEAVRAQLLRIPKVLDLNDKRQAQMAVRRNQLRQDYLQAWLTAEAIREEMAETVPEGSEAFKKLLTDAAARYEELYTTYRLKMAGLYARMFQGRVNQRLGKLQDALGFYTELLDQPDEPDEFRVLKTKTLRMALEAWLHPSEKKYVEAIRRGSDWVKKSRPTDDRDPEWLAIRLSLAKAYKMQADEAEEGDTRTIKQSISEARTQASFVASKRGEFQEEARQLVAALGGPDRTGEKVDPRNFIEARDAGKVALSAGETASVIIEKVPARINREKDEKIKADLQKQLDEAIQMVQTSRTDAMNYFQLALRLANEETSTDDINAVRYYMCYLHFRSEDHYKAALLGEFVSRRYPDSGGGRSCAEIALASYNTLLNERLGDANSQFKELDANNDGQITGDELAALPLIARGGPELSDEEVSNDEMKNRVSEFERNRLVGVAEYIVEKWPEQASAQTALSALVPVMLSVGELDRANEFLTRLPETSPNRGKLEFSTGVSMWGTYLNESRQLQAWEADGAPEGIDLEAKRARINDLRTKAEEILAAGYGRMQATAKPSRTNATALLSLAQAYLESQQAAKAIEVLEHAKLGPLVLVNAGDASTKDPKVAEEIYKTALRAYISSLGGPAGSDAIEKAKGVMDKMKAALGGDAEGEKRLVNVYVNLARDLEKQLESATPEVKRALSQGFETFLRQLNEDGGELSVLNWVAESFSKLGKSLDDSATLNEDAKKYYQASLDAFQNILDKLELDANTKLQVQMRMAGVHSEMRNFDKASSTFEEILSGANANALHVQIEATKLFEQWAKQPGQEDKYKQAISGVRKAGQPKPIIWGWGGIANKTAGNAKYKDTFYDARLRLAQCRYDHAMASDGDDKKKLLAAAKQDISVTNRFYPELGGQQMKPKFDALLKKVQNALGEEVNGLEGL